jgi:type I restriction-modification system DNA methylase subunit
MEFCDMGGAPKEVIELIEQFERNIESYKGQGYGEAQVRQQFINPFFEALGWDMQNKAGVAPAYSDVIHEDAIKVGGTTKAPDYCFRVGGTRKFFLEAKKPSVDIKSDISPAYQLRRYAWSAKLPLSILTDFEEFAVYDCQIRPSPDDKPSAGRIMLFTYKDYADKWEQIANIFSKEAVYKGLFDKYASEKTTKRGTTTVDKEFLAEIEGWRNELAKNIAIRNGKLSVYDLNFAVQKTIDRILFLRICEDRGIERSEQLLGLISGSRIYPRLFELFEKSDERYNSGIFHFRREKDRPEGPDELSANLKIDDDVLTRILKDLYYPRSPYEFSVMPAEILGQVYEQFLGKVIRLTESHQAKVEEKPEVKKAGGVYYTPSYIVDYIVKNTVGKLCENKTPKQIEKLKILDPACGSGSFLIGAYQYLLDFHRDYYAKEPSKHKKVIYQGKGGQWFLTIDEKKRILLNNIYGVDIDSQAAEVTKLSLLLKVLENETQESLRLFHERALPDLGNNIKCGNSLIGPDFYQKQQLTLFGDEQQRKINAFDWQKEFAPIFKQGGFDAVIGNPPYIRIQTMQDTQPETVPYLSQRYKSASKGNYDIYVVFAEKGLGLLNKNGRLGLILPHKFFQAKFAHPVRQLLSEKKAIAEIVHFGAEQVFENATTYTCLLFLSAKPELQFRFVSVRKLENPTQLFPMIRHSQAYPDYSEAFLPQPPSDKEWHFSTGNSAAVLTKLNRQPLTLGNITRKIFVGLQTSADSIYVLNLVKWNKQSCVCYSKSLEKEIEIERGFVKPFLMGKDVHRYKEPKSHNVVIFPYLIENGQALLMPKKYIQERFPMGWKYLLANQNALAQREKGKMIGEHFYAYIYPKNLAEFDAVKLMTPDIASGCQMTLDKEGNYHTTTIYSFVFKETQKENVSFFLGILNSKLLWFFLSSTGNILRGGYFRFKTEYLKPFPIRTIDFDKPEEVKQHDKMVSLVEQMLELNKKLAGIKNPDEKTRIQRQIDSTDEQIDKLVYDLYGLSADEIAIVEGKK